MSFQGRNPFRFGMPAESLDAPFGGRREPVQSVLDAVDDRVGGLFVVSGPRGIGKSSFFHRVMLVARTNRHVAVYVDVTSATIGYEDSGGDVQLRCVLDALAGAFERALELPEETLPRRLDITGFREHVLRRALGRVGDHSLMVVLDEVEALALAYPRALLHLADALGLRPGLGGRSPVVLFGWGRPVGVGKGWSRQQFQIPGAIPPESIELAPLTGPELDGAFVAPFATFIDVDAGVRDAVEVATGGYPLLVAALGTQLFRARRRSGVTEPLTSTEVLDAVPAATRACESVFDWQWSGTEPDVRLVATTIARLQDAEDGPVPSSRVEDLLDASGRADLATRITKVVDGLVADGLVQRVPPASLMVRPRILAGWLARFDPRALASADIDGTSGPAALLEMSKRLEARGDRAAALSVVAQGWEEHPASLPLGLRAAALERGLGRANAALRRLRDLLQRHPGAREVEDQLIAVLVDQGRRLLAEGETRKVTHRLEEIASLDPRYVRTTAARELEADLALGRFETHLRGSPPSEWSHATRQLIACGWPWLDRFPALFRRLLRESLEFQLHPIRQTDEEADDAEAPVPPPDGLELVQHVWRKVMREVPADVQRALEEEGPGAAPLTEGAVGWRELWRTVADVLASVGPLDRVERRRLVVVEGLRAAAAAPTALRPTFLGLVSRHGDDVGSLLLDEGARGAGLVESLVRGGLLAEARALGSSLLHHFDQMERTDPASLRRALVDLGPLVVPLLPTFDEETRETWAVGLTLWFSAAKLEEATASTLGDRRSRDEARAAWAEVLDALSAELGDEATALRHRLDGFAPDPALRVRPAAKRAKLDQDVLDRIRGSWFDSTPVSPPQPVPGVAGATMRTFQALRRGLGGGEWVTVRMYHLPGAGLSGVLGSRGRRDIGSPADLLHSLWETEHRALRANSYRREGRALPRLEHATFVDEHDVLVIATERVSESTLSDVLDHRELLLHDPEHRSALWRHVLALFEAVDVMHGAGWIHRSIHPESIALSFGVGRTAADPGWAGALNAALHSSEPLFKLTRFELCLHVQDIEPKRAGLLQARASLYNAPEVLAAIFEKRLETGEAGVSPRSDLFCLGLVLFELLVEPLPSEELGPTLSEYDEKWHRGWVENLRERCDRARRQRQIDDIELSILKALLVFKPGDRPTSLQDKILGDIRALITPDFKHLSSASHRIHLVATLQRNTDSSIVPMLEDAVDPRLIAKAGGAKAFLEKELSGAAVRRNRTNPERPLIIQTDLLRCCIEPYKGATRGSLDQLQIGFLVLAGNIDEADDTVLVHLGKVAVVDHQRGMELDSKRSPALAALFNLAQGELRRNSEERKLLHAMRLTADLEQDAWKRAIYGFELVAGPVRDGDFEWINIRQDGPGPLGSRRSLAEDIVQAVDREVPWFDLVNRRSLDLPFEVEKRWAYVVPDNAEEGDIWLKRRCLPSSVPPPRRGFIRPVSLAGSRSLMFRRRDALRHLVDDTHLLSAVVNPRQSCYTLLQDSPAPFNNKLDPSKQQVSSDVFRQRPLYVVQGPPGTGKTTLASEVVLQALADQPRQRILITSQSHEPLNNLADRLRDAMGPAFDARYRGNGRPMMVRLASEARLDVSRYGEEGTRIARELHPTTIAERLIEHSRNHARARRAELPDGDEVPPHARLSEAWLTFLDDEEAAVSRALEQRVVDSAQIVFATANDGTLSRMRGDAFDLVVYEEAARSLPLEVLGPLLLARRWLLIGDHQQLPPFGRDEAEETLQFHLKGSKVRRRWQDYVDIFGSKAETMEQARTWLAMFARMFDLGQLEQDDADTGRDYATPSSAGMLAHQWRMHPDLGDMVSTLFYPGLQNGDREQLERMHRLDLPLPNSWLARTKRKAPAVVWVDVPLGGEWSEKAGLGGGWRNGAEARALFDALRALIEEHRDGPAFDFAVLSPYRAQVDVLQSLLKTYKNPRVGLGAGRVHTVDSFQGKEADVVFLSLVRNNMWGELGFLSDEQRATVMFSRASKLLVIVGCSETFRRGPDNWVRSVYQWVLENDFPVVRADMKDEFAEKQHTAERAEASRWHRAFGGPLVPTSGNDDD